MAGKPKKLRDKKTDAQGRIQINSWIDLETIIEIDKAAKELGVSRRKLIETILQEFNKLKLYAEDQSGLFDGLAQGIADNLLKRTEELLDRRLREHGER